MLKKGGVAAMELVAMELKHAGAYIARTLSYDKVRPAPSHPPPLLFAASAKPQPQTTTRTLAASLTQLGAGVV